MATSRTILNMTSAPCDSAGARLAQKETSGWDHRVAEPHLVQCALSNIPRPHSTHIRGRTPRYAHRSILNRSRFSTRQLMKTAVDSPNIDNSSVLVNKHPRIKITRRTTVAGKKLDGVAHSPGWGIEHNTMLLCPKKRNLYVRVVFDLCCYMCVV